MTFGVYFHPLLVCVFVPGLKQHTFVGIYVFTCILISYVCVHRIDFHQLAKPANLKNSAVLRMLEEEEHRQRHGQSPSEYFIVMI